MTQHDDAVQVAAQIAAFRARHLADSDRLLREYASLHSDQERDAEIQSLKGELTEAEEYSEECLDEIDTLKIKLAESRQALVDAKEEIRKLKNNIKEEK